MARKKQERPLTPQQNKFVENYVTLGEAAKAAIAAGYSKRSAPQAASHLLKQAKVRARIKELQAEDAAALHISRQDVIKRWWAMATADARELSQLRLGNCRFCWGNNHAYQWTEEEYNRACAAATEKMEKLAEAGEDEATIAFPDDSGGFGFDQNRPPHPDCPECFGEGTPRVYLADSRELSPETAILFAGVKQTQYGIEIKMHDQQAALREVGKLLGFYVTEDKPDAQAQTTINEITQVNITGSEVLRELGDIFGNAIEGTLAEDEDGAD